MLDAKSFSSGLPILILSMQDGKISGNDGCNNFIGVAAYRNNTIITGAIATTKMACAGNTLQNDFYDFLASKNLSWRLNNDAILRLYVNDAEVMALKERE
jgi:heat shock protein HslJ